MGLIWLGNKNWSDITRDERFFCAHLYKTVLEDRRSISYFVEQINKKCGLRLPLDANWELGFEVCFYRDMAFAFPGQYEMVSPKRTFDLCLFSDDMIVIIEAKAYQPFDRTQTAEFLDDIKNIEEKYKLPVKAVLVPLASSLYEEAFEKSMKKEFGCSLLTWDFLSECYANDATLKNADLTFSLRPKSSDKSRQFLTGRDLMRLYQEYDVDPKAFFVGRSQGTRGLIHDFKDNAWRDRSYEINPNALTAQNKNWFSLEEFAEIISSANPDQ